MSDSRLVSVEMLKAHIDRQKKYLESLDETKKSRDKLRFPENEKEIGKRSPRWA
jgi:hypothetical protein